MPTAAIRPSPWRLSLCVRSQDALWGRYWGSDVDLDHLHFEVCYYAPIEWAITQGIRGFDPGAGGSHKRRRGFLAKPRTSLHRWSDPRFDALLRQWLPRANALMAEEIEAVNADLPFTTPPPRWSRRWPEERRPRGCLRWRDACSGSPFRPVRGRLQPGGPSSPR